MYTIKINFEQPGLETVTLENIEPGQSLLEVCLKNDIELHHNCGGVCACSTCHLYVMKGEDELEELSDREEDFIDRAVNPRLNSRLGCQCVLIGDEFNEGRIYRVRFTDLLEWVLQLPNFEGKREESNEGHLEMIQSAWVYEWRDNQKSS